MTQKLFWDETGTLKFDAEVVNQGTDNGKTYIVLNQTAFYPTGGGQPSDNGIINSVKVSDVLIDDNDGTIRHYLESATKFRNGSIVCCEVNKIRRQDHTQQHSGQHILSQAFFQLFGTETNGFRIGDSTSEIDLKFDQELTTFDSIISEAVSLANTIVFENRKVTSSIQTEDEVSRLPLRKDSTVKDCIRIIEIENFDLSPCGGTHVSQTGEVGIVLVKNWTRAKQMLRLEFLCGTRAINEYQEANKIVSQICRALSTGREGAIDSIQKLVEWNKAYEKQLKALTNTLINHEAADLIQSNNRVVAKVFEKRPYEEIRILASRLASQSSVIALLATVNDEKVQLVFASSVSENQNVADLMREVCQHFGGKGGGTPTMAQGGFDYSAEFENYFSEIQKRF